MVQEERLFNKVTQNVSISVDQEVTVIMPDDGIAAAFEEMVEENIEVLGDLISKLNPQVLIDLMAVEYMKDKTGTFLKILAKADILENGLTSNEVSTNLSIMS